MTQRQAQSISEQIAAHQLVFVTGLHRSGTSLLFRCLRDHPQISGFHGTGVPEDEGQHLQTVIPSARPYGGPGRFGFHPESYLDEHSPLAQPEAAAKMFEEWAPHWDLSREILIEKTPTTLVRTRFFQALYPDAKFIVVLRHPLAVTYATYKWKGWTLRKRDGLTPGQLIEHWLLVHERFAADFQHLNAVKVLLYEELVTRPAAFFDEIYSFLDIPSFPLQQEIRPHINKKYFEQWEQFRRHPLKKLYASQIVSKYEERVNRFGYSLQNLSKAELPAQFDR